MTSTFASIIAVAAPWASGALVIAAGIVLLPLAFGPSRTMLALLRTNVFAASPLLTVILAALAAQGVGTPAEGAEIGAVVGAGALLGTTLGLTLLGAVAGSTPAIQEFVRNSEPHPEARLPYRWIGPLGMATGAFTGLMLGGGNLLLAMLVGMMVGIMR